MEHGLEDIEQSFATGRISVPLVLSGETPSIPEYNFLDNKIQDSRHRTLDSRYSTPEMAWERRHPCLQSSTYFHPRM